MKHDWAKFVGCYNFIVVMNESKSFIEGIIWKNIYLYWNNGKNPLHIKWHNICIRTMENWTLDDKNNQKHY
jgi:hypothetical protein